MYSRDKGLMMMMMTMMLFSFISVTEQALPAEWQKQIDASRADVKRIMDHIKRGPGKHQTFNRLALLGDEYGPRMSGTQALEDAIDYIRRNLTDEGFDNVHNETALVPSWTRGTEYGFIHTPKYVKKMFVMALGTSVGTNGNVTGQTIVFQSFAEMEASNEVTGKIVVFNQPWENYGQSGQYRREGARRAEKKGARAVLIRSVTGRSIYSPHTGVQEYDPDPSVEKIPAACIPVEDAQLLWRFQQRGKPLQVTIYMEALPGPNKTSHNLIAEIKGSVYPDQTVIFGGHIDTWDVTDGSMDDGGGVMMAWEAFSVMKRLELKPKRTVRLVLWTSEEYGLIGSEQYFHNHSSEVNKTALVMQADGGSFKPYGVKFSGSGLARSIMEEIVGMLDEINATQVQNGGGASSDTGLWVTAGVPGTELLNANENYFDYHHTYGDAMNALDPDDLDGCTAVWAVVAYTVANMDELLPRDGGYVSGAVTQSSSVLVIGSVTLLLRIIL